MKLSEAFHLTPQQAHAAARRLLNEEQPAAPRWSFNYANATNDPSPNALVLGTHQNQSGNEVVGGINLNYLDQGQIKSLRAGLPRIMLGANLQQRYRIGKQILPDIFERYYRTYRSDYINAVQPAELSGWRTDRPAAPPHPAPDPSQPVQPPRPTRMPQRPPTPPRPPGAATPPMRPTPAPQPDVDDLELQQQRGMADLQRLATLQQQRAEELRQLQAKRAQRQAAIRAHKELQQQQQQNRHELEVPNPENVEKGDPLAVPESITYWSPSRRRYITEWVVL